MTYAELASRVAPEAVSAKASELAAQTHLELPERSKLLTAQGGRTQVSQGRPWYWALAQSPILPCDWVMAALAATIRNAIRPSGSARVSYFPGISDMSFLGSAAGNADAVNTPLAGSSFDLPDPPGYPVINIGPWGRDYHHWLERLHAPYAFDVLPRVLLSVMAAVLDND